MWSHHHSQPWNMLHLEAIHAKETMPLPEIYFGTMTFGWSQDCKEQLYLGKLFLKHHRSIT